MLLGCARLTGVVMVALPEVPRNAEGAHSEGCAHKGHPTSAASSRIKACAPKDAQSPTLSLPFERIAADQRLHGHPPLRRYRRTTGPNHRAIGSYRRPTNHIAKMTTTINTPTARMYSSPPIATHPLPGGATTSAIQWPTKL
jgi:hypothetical protein